MVRTGWAGVAERPLEPSDAHLSGPDHGADARRNDDARRSRASAPLEPRSRFGYSPRHDYEAPETPAALHLGLVMKVRNSLKSLRNRHRDNRLVRRKGRVYIINKTQKRYKARQG